MPTIRNNIVKFKAPGVTNVEFICEKYKISEDQPYEEKIEITLCKEQSEWKMNIKAGRHGTEEVAEWFEKETLKDEKGAVVACDSHDNMPKKLNFAVKGTLSMTFRYGKKIDISDVVIAQGHNSHSRNNWWFGGMKFCKVGNVEEISRFLKVKGIAVSTSISEPPEYYIFNSIENSENRFNITYVSIM